MSFYSKWNNNINDIEHIDAFLAKDPISIFDYYVESDVLQKAIISALLDIDSNELITRITEKKTDINIATNQVPQFSSFEAGTKKICEILDFYPEGLSFTDVGYKLCKASNYTGCIKYGENHAKLANTLHLVDINKRKGSTVKLTPFGREILKITNGKERQIFQKLLLREDLVKVLIMKGIEGKVSYREVVSSLSDTTAIRRRTNTKCYLSNALSGTSYEYVFDNVIW